MRLTVTKDGRVNPLADFQIGIREFEAIVGLLERKRKRKLERKGLSYKWNLKKAAQ